MARRSVSATWRWLRSPSYQLCFLNGQPDVLTDRCQDGLMLDVEGMGLEAGQVNHSHRLVLDRHRDAQAGAEPLGQARQGFRLYLLQIPGHLGLTMQSRCTAQTVAHWHPLVLLQKA